VLRKANGKLATLYQQSSGNLTVIYESIRDLSG